MKDFDYYSTPQAEYFGHDDQQAYKQRLLAEINDARMTAAERDAATAEIKERVRDFAYEKNAPYQEQVAALDAEFWRDAREELGYDKLLDSDGAAALESKAWQDGHAHGYSSVFYHLTDLTEFCETIVKHLRVNN